MILNNPYGIYLTQTLYGGLEKYATFISLDHIQQRVVTELGWVTQPEPSLVSIMQPFFKTPAFWQMLNDMVQSPISIHGVAITFPVMKTGYIQVQVVPLDHDGAPVYLLGSTVEHWSGDTCDTYKVKPGTGERGNDPKYWLELRCFASLPYCQELKVFAKHTDFTDKSCSVYQSNELDALMDHLSQRLNGPESRVVIYLPHRQGVNYSRLLAPVYAATSDVVTYVADDGEAAFFDHLANADDHTLSLHLGSIPVGQAHRYVRKIHAIPQGHHLMLTCDNVPTLI